MKSIVLIILTFVGLVVSSLRAAAEESRTLISGDTATDTLTLAVGDSARLVFAFNSNTGGKKYAVDLLVAIGGQSVTMPGVAEDYSAQSQRSQVSLPFEISGPATIKLLPHSVPGGERIYATFSVTRLEAPSTTPTNAAVIPEDANGQFQVILESSTDLITWTPANPGLYDGNAAKRFFRTRIVRQ